jgi:hypothetical protein
LLRVNNDVDVLGHDDIRHANCRRLRADSMASINQ